MFSGHEMECNGVVINPWFCISSMAKYAIL